MCIQEITTISLAGHSTKHSRNATSATQQAGDRNNEGMAESALVCGDGLWLTTCLPLACCNKTCEAELERGDAGILAVPHNLHISCRMGRYFSRSLSNAGRGHATHVRHKSRTAYLCGVEAVAGNRGGWDVLLMLGSFLLETQQAYSAF
jgi:hypothetical protein